MRIPRHRRCPDCTEAAVTVIDPEFNVLIPRWREEGEKLTLVDQGYEPLQRRFTPCIMGIWNLLCLNCNWWSDQVEMPATWEMKTMKTEVIKPRCTTTTFRLEEWPPRIPEPVMGLPTHQPLMVDPINAEEINRMMDEIEAEEAENRRQDDDPGF